MAHGTSYPCWGHHLGIHSCSYGHQSVFFTACRGWSSSSVSPTCALLTHHHHIRWSCDYYDGCFAVVVLADALPPLLRSSGGCFAALATPTPTDALPSWLLLVGRPRWMLCRRGDVLVDAWPPSCYYMVSVSDLVLVHFVWVQMLYVILFGLAG